MRLVVDLQGAQGASQNRGIGRYSRELAMAMARHPRDHEVVLALNGTLGESAHDLAERFSTLLPDENIRTWFSPNPAEPNRYVGKAAEIIRAQFLASLKPDLVHITSVFEGLGEPNITGSPSSLERLPLAATFYDLIPYIRRDQYLSETGAIGPHGWWYFARLQEMLLMDGLLAISDYSRKEAIDYLGIDPGTVWNIQAGVHSSFNTCQPSATERHSLLARYGLEDSFILFVGAGDVRKNEAGLIDAYVRLPELLRQRHQLLIVGHVPHDALRQQLVDAGCSQDRLVTVPFVKEGDLQKLYAICELFVFPSLHEGFGLPAAEAMACGAPVIASNTSSLPEVVGLPEALFDPESPIDIAAHMTRVLEDPSFRLRLKEHGIERARLFTWEASASRAWDALEGTLDRIRLSGRRPVSVLAAKPSLAFISPLPPQPSGISDYSRTLLPALSRYYDITLVCESGDTDDEWLRAAFPVIDAQTFRSKSGQFERVLYQVGSSPFHSFQYLDLLPTIPGVTVLHDAFLSPVWHWHAVQEGKNAEFLAELYTSHGYPALKYAASYGLDAAVEAYPSCLSVLDRSLSVIQHSRHGLDLLAHHYGEEIRDRVSIVPLVSQARFRPPRAEARRRLGLPSDQFIVCSFGMIAPTKMSTTLFEAWQHLEEADGKLVFVGALAMPESLPWSAENPPASAEVTGRVDQHLYDLWLAAADLAVQLRTNSRGETSAAIADCLSAGLPLIVNAHGSAAEIPDDIVVKLTDRFSVHDLCDAIADLRRDPERRTALGVAGKAYAAGSLGAASIASKYREIIENAYRPEGSGLQPLMSESLARLARNFIEGEDLRLEAVAASAQASLSFKARGRHKLLIGVANAQQDAEQQEDSSLADLRPLLLASSIGKWRCEAVHFVDGTLVNAYSIGTSLLDCPPLQLCDDAVDTSAGDVLLLFEPDVQALTQDDILQLKQKRLSGLRIVVAIDRLPKNSDVSWPSILNLAESVLCLSHSAAERIVAWLRKNEPHGNRPRIYVAPGENPQSPPCDPDSLLVAINRVIDREQLELPGSDRTDQMIVEMVC